MSLEWRGAPVEPGSGAPSPPAWEDVTVPGRPAQFAGREAVAYRTTFSDPREANHDHAVLELDGAYAHARVWLNGEQVTEHDAYFEPIRAPLPVEEENELIVECRRPEDRFGGLEDTDLVPESRGVPGIWWGAAVETYPDPFVSRLQIAPSFDVDPTDVAAAEEGAGLEVRATVVTDEALDDRLTLSTRPEGDVRGGGMMSRARVQCGPGPTTITERIEVRDPSLWWPRDLGSQPRYVVRAKLDDAERTRTTGLRAVTRDEEAGLHVNGRRIGGRGVALVDPTPEDVDRAVDLGANLVRGRASVLSPAVYEACDEAGVLVWQDLPLTGPRAFDVDRGRDLAERLLDARRHHPSLAAASVHDAPVEDVGDGLGSGFLDRLRYRWRAWRASYDRSDAERVADAVDGLPVFPVVGSPGIDPDAAALYPGWTFGEPADVEWLCDRYGLGDVVAAFGAGAFGTESASESTGDARGGVVPEVDGGDGAEVDGGDGADGDETIPGFDRERHDARAGSDPAESQAYQAEVVGRVAELLRWRGADLLVLDSLRDLGAAGTGVVSADGTPKAAFDRLATAYSPTQVFLSDPSPGESEIRVVHDRPDAATATVEWDVDGDREQTEVHVGAHGRASVETVELSEGDEVTLAVAVGDDVARNEYAI